MAEYIFFQTGKFLQTCYDHFHSLMSYRQRYLNFSGASLGPHIINLKREWFLTQNYLAIFMQFAEIESSNFYFYMVAIEFWG